MADGEKENRAGTKLDFRKSELIEQAEKNYS